MHTTDELAAEVLDLPISDRAKILELLLASFSPANLIEKPSGIQVAISRREEVRTGKVKMLPGDLALQELKAKYS
jgi:hypothetical protein